MCQKKSFVITLFGWFLMIIGKFKKLFLLFLAIFDD